MFYELQQSRFYWSVNLEKYSPVVFQGNGPASVSYGALLVSSRDPAGWPSTPAAFGSASEPCRHWRLRRSILPFSFVLILSLAFTAKVSVVSLRCIIPSFCWITGSVVKLYYYLSFFRDGNTFFSSREYTHHTVILLYFLFAIPLHSVFSSAHPCTPSPSLPAGLFYWQIPSLLSLLFFLVIVPPQRPQWIIHCNQPTTIVNIFVIFNNHASGHVIMTHTNSHSSSQSFKRVYNSHSLPILFNLEWEAKVRLPFSGILVWYFLESFWGNINSFYRMEGRRLCVFQ